MSPRRHLLTRLADLAPALERLTIKSLSQKQECHHRRDYFRRPGPLCARPIPRLVYTSFPALRHLTFTNGCCATLAMLLQLVQTSRALEWLDLRDTLWDVDDISDGTLDATKQQELWDWDEWERDMCEAVKAWPALTHLDAAWLDKREEDRLVLLEDVCDERGIDLAWRWCISNVE